MLKTKKGLAIAFLLPACGLLAYQQSCKTVSNKDVSTESGFKNPIETIKIKNQIHSFNDAQEQLIAAEKRGAKGCEKLDILWNKIVETQQSEKDMLPPEGKPKEIIAFGNGSALRFWRAFEGWGQDEGGSDIRPYELMTTNSIRLTHRYAVLAKFKFVVNAEAVKKLGYTGQYAQGNDCVLGRLSSAVPTSVKDRFTPAFAGKFFQDGNTATQSLIVQHDIGGQSSGTDYTVSPPRAKSIDNNFYTKYLSNRLSFEKGVYSGVGAFSRFFFASQWLAKNFLKLDYVFDPRELQANHLAQKSTDGSTVANPKGPRFVWFAAPNAKMKNEFGAMASEDLDFRKHFLALNGRIDDSKGLNIFNVYASDTWTYEPEKEATLIGQMVAVSDFAVSEAADVRLFYKHAIQFHKIAELEGKPNPYTQDFDFKDWTADTFTKNCRLGVNPAEVEPSSMNKLNGSFITTAALNPMTRRHGDNGSVCLNNVIEEKLEETLAPLLKDL